eukprot:5394836-Amphidinium_carterae.1
MAEGARHTSSTCGSSFEVVAAAASGDSLWHGGCRRPQRTEFRAVAGDTYEAHAGEAHADRLQALVLHAASRSIGCGGQGLPLVAEESRGQDRIRGSCTQGGPSQHRSACEWPLPS